MLLNRNAAVEESALEIVVAHTEHHPKIPKPELVSQAPPVPPSWSVVATGLVVRSPWTIRQEWLVSIKQGAAPHGKRER